MARRTYRKRQAGEPARDWQQRRKERFLIRCWVHRRHHAPLRRLSRESGETMGEIMDRAMDLFLLSQELAKIEAINEKATESRI